MLTTTGVNATIIKPGAKPRIRHSAKPALNAAAASTQIPSLRQPAQVRTDILNALLARSDRYPSDCRHWGINE